MTLRPRRLLAGASLALALSAAAAPAATAAPATVNLRVEGATRTLFQGPVTTDALASIGFPGSGGSHPCNVRDNTGVPADPVAPSPFSALVASGLPLDAGWFSSSPGGDFFVTSAGGDAQTSTAFWGFAVNYQEAMVGGCQIPLTNGQTVLWAWDYFSQNELLTLEGPTVMNVGEYASFAVRNGRNNVGVTGATVAGATTDQGIASVSFTGVGVYDVQATKPGALRSNIVRVCVHAGNDGNCGFPNDGTPPAPAPVDPGPAPAPSPSPAPIAPVTPVTPVEDAKPPVAKVAGIKRGQTFRAAKAPRELSGSVRDAGGVQRVQARLKRRVADACWGFDGGRERFRSIACDEQPKWLTVGDGADWSYLLPEQLERGRYVLQVRATDAAGNTGKATKVRFRVA